MQRWGMGICLLAAGLVLAGRPAVATVSLDELRTAHARVRDLVIEAERIDLREEELKRMQRNAGSMLEFSRVKLYFMAPDRLRVEGRRGLVPITVVQNGDTQLVRLGLGLKSRKNLADAIRRKQSGLEFGLLSGEVWQDYQVNEVGSEAIDGHEATVLHLRVRGERPNSSFQKVWVDTQTHRVVRRDRYSGDGKLKCRQLFRDPFRSPAGTWLSRRIEVYNEYGRYVGALSLTNITVNNGLAESLFRT